MKQLINLKWPKGPIGTSLTSLACMKMYLLCSMLARPYYAPKIMLAYNPPKPNITDSLLPIRRKRVHIGSQFKLQPLAVEVHWHRN